MSNRFCGQCGAQLTGGNFCGQCGAPVPAEPTTSDQLSTETASGPARDEPGTEDGTTEDVRAQAATTAPPPPPNSGATPAPGSTPKSVPNPFAGIAFSDAVRDILAAIALFSALGLSWNVGEFEWDTGGAHWWVIISVLISVASLAIPYLHLAKLLGPLGASEVRLIKLAASLPAVASILAVIIDDLAHFNDYDAGGLGGGIVMLAAGAALAAQPRSFEETPAHVTRLWRFVGIITGWLAVVVAVATLVRWLVFADEAWDPVLSTIAVIVVTVVLFGIVSVYPFILATGRSFSGLVIFSTGGATAALTELLATMGDSSAFSSAETKFNQPFMAATFLVAVSASILSSRIMMRNVKRSNTATDWIAVVRMAFTLMAVFSLLYIVGAVLGYAGSGDWSGSKITVLVLMVLIGASAGLAAVLLNASPAGYRTICILILTGEIILGIVVLTVGHVNYAMTFNWIVTSALFSLPVLAICALTIPKPVREQFGPLYSPPTGS